MKENLAEKPVNDYSTHGAIISNKMKPPLRRPYENKMKTLNVTADYERESRNSKQGKYRSNDLMTKSMNMAY